MKTWFLGFTLNLLVAAAGANAQPPPQPPAAPIPGAPTTADTNAIGPRIQFAALIHDFGRITSGSSARHEFVFTNTGDALLEVPNVAPGCGCTTAGDWTRKVEPGKTGTIPLQFNSASFNGPVAKSVTVTTTDKRQPTVVLQLKGDIWKAVEVNPTYAVLQANKETLADARTTVRIVNREEQPLVLSPPECNNLNFAVQLNTNVPGKEFELVVRGAPPSNPGNLQGVITVKTSSTNMPTLTVTVMAVLQPVLVTVPPQLHLPPPPLASALALSVSITNQGTNTLVLSEPKVSLDRVTVDLAESVPGRKFTATVRFPAQFQIAPGTPAELSLKSNHPDHPTLRVPIIQAVPRPAVPTVAAPPAPAAFPAPPVPTVAPSPPASSSDVEELPASSLAPPPLPPGA